MEVPHRGGKVGLVYPTVIDGELVALLVQLGYDLGAYEIGPAYHRDAHPTFLRLQADPCDQTRCPVAVGSGRAADSIVGHQSEQLDSVPTTPSRPNPALEVPLGLRRSFLADLLGAKSST